MTPPLVPLTLLTGFLGAGKTTFLNRMIAEPGFGRTAVIVNEFGEAGVDGAIVTPADEGAVEMTVGCLCCTVSGDVRRTLFRLLDDKDRGVGPDFERIVIETTGLADPSPLLQTFLLDSAVQRRIALNGVVTLVDAVNAEHALERFEEARRQVAVADLALVAKTDLARDPASQADLEDLKADLARRNPNAQVMDAQAASAETIFSLAAFDPAAKPPEVGAVLKFDPPAGDHDHNHDHAHHGPHDVNRHDDAASAYCFTADAPIDFMVLSEAVSALQASFGPDLLRMKGIVSITDAPSRPVLFQVAGHAVGPPRRLAGWPDGVDATRIVMILGGPMRAEAPRMLQTFLPALRPFAGG